MIRFPPRRILVGFDRSACSLVAWRHATALAARCGAELELVYIEPWRTAGSSPLSGSFVLPGLTPASARSIRKGLRASVGDGPTITVAEGDPAVRLLQLARAHHADMIVVGTHGRRGLTRFLLGSVAEAVLRASPVPVLVARGPVKAIQSILSPVQFTSYSDHGFAVAAELAAWLDARLTALHVDVDPIWGGNAIMRLRRLVEALPGEMGVVCEPRVVLDEDPCRGILRAALKQDLIVLVAHKKSALKDALLGMTAEKILRYSRKPLLIVPPPVRAARSFQRSAQPASHRPSPRR